MARSFIPWPGGKSIAADSLIGMFPTGCRMYMEPFMGAASVFWSLPDYAFEQFVLNDLNEDLVNLFRVVRDRPEEMAKIYKWLLHSRATFKEMLRIRRGEIKTGHDRDVERAVSYFYLLKTGHNTCPKSDGNFRSGKQEIKSMFNPDFDLEPYRRRLKNCVIEQFDFEELITRYDKSDAFIFVDPPYVGVGDALYEHHFDDDQHRRLAKVLKGVKAKWMLTYNDHELVRKLYKGYREFKATWAYCSTAGKTADGEGETRDGLELVITNYEPMDSTPLFA